jgi:hypothetical protein
MSEGSHKQNAKSRGAFPLEDIDYKGYEWDVLDMQVNITAIGIERGEFLVLLR